jgi:acyl dehydratase
VSQACKPKLIRFANLPGTVGITLGPSSWHVIDQARVDRFANATDDNQWIHVDEDRAAETPFGGTVAHGYLTLSLTPALLDEIVAIDESGMVLNYGVNKVRFPAPLLVGDRVRMTAEIASAEAANDGSTQVVYALTFEAEQAKKPCCVAEIVFRYYPQASPAAPEARAPSAGSQQATSQHESSSPAARSTSSPARRETAAQPDPTRVATAWLRWLGGSYELWATSLERSRRASVGDLDALMPPIAEHAELAARFWADLRPTGDSTAAGTRATRPTSRAVPRTPPN